MSSTPLRVGVDTSALRSLITRDEQSADPVSWVESTLSEHLWSKQREILYSLRDNRRTIVHSCHSSGKSYLCARAAAWWITSHKPGEAFVITSAPTWRQVRAILWREIGRAHAKGKLPGRVNQTEWWLRMPEGNEEIVAMGSKPDNEDTSAFQGIHQRYVLVILDEATGIGKPLWDAADTLISNEGGRILAVDNPDDPLSEAAEVSKPGSGWNVIHISAFDTPNFTGEVVPDKLKYSLISPVWVEEKKRKWGESNPLYIAKILGQFPAITTDGLIPMQWIRAAQQRVLIPEGGVELGVDVGGGGTGKSVTARRQGSVVRILRRSREPNTMTTLGTLLADIKSTSATVARVDNVGIGKGMADRAKEIRGDQSQTKDARDIASRITGINVGLPAEDRESYVNARAENYWHLRERFQDETVDIDPADDDLAAQLIDLRYKHVAGRVQIESKEDMRRRGSTSPDDADAVMLAFASKGGKRKVRAVWGSRRRKQAAGASG